MSNLHLQCLLQHLRFSLNRAKEVSLRGQWISLGAGNEYQWIACYLVPTIFPPRVGTGLWAR